MKIPKPRRIVRRNPISAEVARNPLYRTRIMPSAVENEKKRDPWDRDAKHNCVGDDLCADDDDDMDNILS